MAQTVEKRRLDYLVLAATVVGSSMSFIDGSVVNLALPSIQTDLNASVVDIQWIVEINALMIGALILVGGSMGDRFGRRRIFSLGVILFGISSLLCGLAANPQQLIWLRGLQGIGGALLIPGSLAIISSYFSEANKGWAIGTWSGFTALTTALGPVIGGWFIENFSWRWAFFINLPSMVITLILLFLFVPESRDESSPPTLDWVGAVLATLALGGIVFAFTESSSLGWGNVLVQVALVGGIAALVGFIYYEGVAPNPMMPLNLFESRTFLGANLFTLLLYGALGATFFFTPLNLIQLQEYSAVAAGATFLPAIILIFTLSSQSGRLADRFGARPLMIAGGLLASAGFSLFALQGIGGPYWRTFLWPVLVLGSGLALLVPPLTTAVMSAVDSRFSGIASGINNAMSRVAGLLAIAILGFIILSTFNGALDGQLIGLDLTPQQAEMIDSQRIRMAAIDLPEDLDGPLRAQLEGAIDLAFLAGYRRVMFINAGLAALSALIAWWLVE